MVDTAQGVPGLPQVSMVDQKGNPTGPWYSFFVSLWNRTGGASGSISALIDNISSIPGSILYRGASFWSGLGPGLEFDVLRMGAEFPEWDTLDGQSFGNQTQGDFFIGPILGSGNPSFRAVASSDLAPVAGQFPGTNTNDNAAAGHVGEYVVGTVLQASAVSLVSNTPQNVVSIALSAGDWDVSLAAYFIPSSGAAVSLAAGYISTASATANMVAGFFGQMSNLTGNSFIVSTSVPKKRFSLASGETIFFVADAIFTGGTVTAFGEISARRVR